MASRGKTVPSAIIDLLILVALWTTALMTRPTVLDTLGGSRILLLLIWLLVGMFIGFVKTKIAYPSGLDHMPDTELPEHAQVKESAVSGNIFKRAWEGWKLFAAEMGHVQGALFMGFFYFIVVTIFGLGARMFTDPMALKSTPSSSGWVARKPLDSTLEQALEQGQTD